MSDAPPRWAEPSTPADLHLPPTFVADHAIRTLAYQGAMTPSEIARRWRVGDAIVTDAIDSLKGAGVVELDAGQATFGPGGRVRLLCTIRACSCILSLPSSMLSRSTAISMQSAASRYSPPKIS